jgi:hypothetical protein
LSHAPAWLKTLFVLAVCFGCLLALHIDYLSQLASGSIGGPFSHMSGLSILRSFAPQVNQHMKQQIVVPACPSLHRQLDPQPAHSRLLLHIVGSFQIPQLIAATS